MILSARVAAMAAAVIGLTLSVAGEPLQADAGAGDAVTSYYTDHADAAAFSDLGLNQETAEAEAVAERMTRLAEAAVPRPRTLDEQVAAYKRADTADAEQDCLASAVYFEARGEPIEGQLAVADVVLNRVASERYPDTICEVVEQPWQFSFVNATGRIPEANRSSEAWEKAVAIARIAQARAAREVQGDVLWYHADYVSPSWGRRLARQEKIGLHIFYS
jgi:spore germination cell wall hydrolase CwlJ-like protein